jgi:uncharacterized sulfatase
MNTTRLAIILVSFLTTVLAAAEPATRWNVLFIIADDLNNDLGCYGNTIVKSPNIDRLAAGGVRFERAWCQYPVCNASRTSFLSGRRPDTTGVIDNSTPPRTHLKDAVMLPEHFRRNGYTTIKVGKIFHTGDAFEDPRSWDTDIRETSEAKNPPKSQIIEKGEGVVLNAKDEETWDGFVARKAAALMEQAARDGKPFFVAAGFRRPHTPYIAPKKYFDLYPPEKLTPRPEPPAHVKLIPPIALTYNLGSERLTESRRRPVMSAYYASISFMDAQVGVLLEALDRLRLRDRTVVVFLGDHGYHLGEHGGLWHKMTVFEEASRVPLILAVPGKKPAVSARLVELVDLFPTLAELCGLAKPDGLEGLSLVPLLDRPERPWKTAAFTVVSHAGKVKGGAELDPEKLGRTVRTERWRYTEWFDGSVELYDHEADPHELANLAKSPKHTATLAQLKQTLAAGWKAALPE